MVAHTRRKLYLAGIRNVYLFYLLIPESILGKHSTHRRIEMTCRLLVDMTCHDNQIYLMVPARHDTAAIVYIEIFTGIIQHMEHRDARRHLNTYASVGGQIAECLIDIRARYQHLFHLGQVDVLDGLSFGEQFIGDKHLSHLILTDEARGVGVMHDDAQTATHLILIAAIKHSDSKDEIGSYTDQDAHFQDGLPHGRLK